MHDYNLHTIADVCLQGAGGSVAAQTLCERIKRGITDHTFRPYNYERTLQSIFQLQPRIALDVFFGAAAKTDGAGLEFDAFANLSDRRKNSLDAASEEEILRWCDEKPAERYPVLSGAVSYQIAPKEGRNEWTPLAIEILKRAPDPVAILKIFVRRFYPQSWSGSRAAIVESRLGLLDRISELKNASLDEYVTRIRPKLIEDIVRNRESENECDSVRDGRFE